MKTFPSKDAEEQFNEKVALIALEELKEIKRKEFIQKIMSHPRIIIKRSLGTDEDYDRDIDSEVQDYKIETINQ